MDSGVTVSLQFLAALSGVILPLLVGVVTKEVANAGLKSALLAFFSVASGLAVSAQQGNGFISKEAAVAAFMSWVVAVASYYGFWKPNGTAQAVQAKTSKFGVG